MARKRLINFYKGKERNYEVTLILSQKLSAEAIKNKVEELKKVAESLGAKVNQTAHTNLKSYCYPIKMTNNKKGYYACLYTIMLPELVSQLRTKLSIQDDVLRIMIILANPKKQSLGLFASNYEENSYNPKKRLISYDDPNLLIKFLGESGIIEPRKQSMGKNISHGVALKQRTLSREIKRSRFLSLLPYIEE